eukprot:scaffold18611_cov159-Skeletonema_marinoi.AAC.1
MIVEEICNCSCRDTVPYWNMTDEWYGTQLLFGVQLAFRMQRHKNANSLILNLSHEVVVRTFGIDVAKVGLSLTDRDVYSSIFFRAYLYLPPENSLLLTNLMGINFIRTNEMSSLGVRTLRLNAVVRVRTYLARYRVRVRTGRWEVGSGRCM